MSTALDSRKAFHRGTAAIFSLLSVEQTERLAELQGDPELADRIVVLAEKANEGELTDGERAEYEGYIEANDLLAILQAEARFHLAKRPH